MLEQPHRRLNPLSGDWVLVSPQRSQRPWQGQVEDKQDDKLPVYDPSCYLCPRNPRAGGVVNPKYTGTFVFANDFSALLPDNHRRDSSSKGLFRFQSETGICKVVCFSPRHDQTIPEMTLEDVEKVVQTWASESKPLYDTRGIRYVQVFENKGKMMGCSNPHPHSQLWSQSNLPIEIIKETQNQQLSM
jgi:UDPglucose--hexose-1-phosphate uridylyltransferase